MMMMPMPGHSGKRFENSLHRPKIHATAFQHLADGRVIGGKDGRAIDLQGEVQVTDLPGKCGCRTRIRRHGYFQNRFGSLGNNVAGVRLAVDYTACRDTFMQIKAKLRAISSHPAPAPFCQCPPVGFQRNHGVTFAGRTRQCLFNHQHQNRK